MTFVGWLRGSMSLLGQHHIPEFVVVNYTIIIHVHKVQDFMYMFLINKRSTKQFRLQHLVRGGDNGNPCNGSGRLQDNGGEHSLYLVTEYLKKVLL